jgi:hypothetical protein
MNVTDNQNAHKATGKGAIIRWMSSR